MKTNFSGFVLHAPSPSVTVIWNMIADIRHHLHAAPFEPFSVVTSSGDRYHISSADHANIHPHGSRIVIWFDDDGSVTVSGLHIVAIEKEPARKKKAA